MKPEDLTNLEGVLEPGTVINFFPSLTSLERQQLYVKKVLSESRAAYEDLDVFENVVLVINDIDPDVTKMEGCEPKHIWKAIAAIKGIAPEIELAHEVQLYIKMIHNEDGCYFYPPDIGLDEENELLPLVMQRASIGPFPLDSDYIGLQAAKYLKIQLYVGE